MALYCPNDTKPHSYVFASTSLPTNDNAPIWSMPIGIHRNFLLGRLLLSNGRT